MGKQIRLVAERNHEELNGGLRKTLARAEWCIERAAVRPDRAERAQHLAEAYSLLSQLRASDFPRTMAWCVVKHYSSPDWKPAIWTAHVDRDQAESFRDAIDAHYTSISKRHEWTPDKWTVEERPALITDFIHPLLTAEEYVSKLPKG